MSNVFVALVTDTYFYVASINIFQNFFLNVLTLAKIDTNCLVHLADVWRRLVYLTFIFIILSLNFRIPLEQTVLDCKTYSPNERIEDFLSQLPEPPSQRSIQFAVNDLIDLGKLFCTSDPPSLPFSLKHKQHIGNYDEL